MTSEVKSWKSDYSLKEAYREDLLDFKVKTFGIDEFKDLFHVMSNVVHDINNATSRPEAYELSLYKDDLFSKTVISGEDLLELQHKILLLTTKYDRLPRLRKLAQMFTYTLMLFEYYAMH